MLFEKQLNIHEIVLMTKVLSSNIECRNSRIITSSFDYDKLVDILIDLSLTIRELLRDTNFHSDLDISDICPFYDSITDHRVSEIVDEFTYIICDFYKIYLLIDYPRRNTLGEYFLGVNENGDYYTKRKTHKYRDEIEFLFTDDNGNTRWATDTLVSNQNDKMFLWHHADVRLDGLKVRYREVGCDDI